MRNPGESNLNNDGQFNIDSEEALDFGGINEYVPEDVELVKSGSNEIKSRWGEAMMRADNANLDAENPKEKPDFDEPVIRGFDLD